MKYSLLLLIFLFITSRAMASPLSHCKSSEQILFNCQIKNSSKVLSMCAAKRLTKEAGYLQYRFGPIGNIELEFPKEKQKSQSKFLFAHYFRALVNRVEVAFAKGDFQYIVYSYYEGEEKPSIMDHGVSVKHKAKHSILSCGRPVTSNLLKLEEVVLCDKENALNLGRCSL